MQMTAEAANAECDFSEQLQNLMGSLAAESDGKGTPGATEEQSAKPEAGKKKEDPFPQSVILAIFAAMAPAPLPGNLGLPSAGDEAGPTLTPLATAPAVILNMEPSIEIDAPAPPATDAAINPNVELAFAIRLADLAGSREPLPVVQVTNRAQPQASSAEPIRIIPEAQGPAAQATPAVAAMPQQDASAADSSQSNSHSSEQKPAESAPKPQQERIEHLSAQTAGPEPVRHATSITATGNPAPSPAPIAVASSTEPHSSNSDTAVANTVHQVDAAPALRPTSTSEVTEISMTVPVSRADSAGEERVAIHMVQRGTEVHVSVRTTDPGVAQSLRQDLTKLTSSLNDAGFRGETWRPATATVAGPSSTNTQHDTAQETPNRNTAGEDGRSGGNNGRQPGEQRRRQQDERPRWVAELEQQRNR
jgi:hypothetical protein